MSLYVPVLNAGDLHSGGAHRFWVLKCSDTNVVVKIRSHVTFAFMSACLCQSVQLGITLCVGSVLTCGICINMWHLYLDGGH